MNFIENDEFHVPDQVGAAVKHAPQNLGRHLEGKASTTPLPPTERPTHDQTRRFRVDLHVSREDSDVFRAIGGLEVSEFLIRQCLDGRCVDRSVEKARVSYGYR